MAKPKPRLPDGEWTPEKVEAFNDYDALAILACGQRDRFRRALEEIAEYGDTLSQLTALKALGGR